MCISFPDFISTVNRDLKALLNEVKSVVWNVPMIKKKYIVSGILIMVNLMKLKNHYWISSSA